MRRKSIKKYSRHKKKPHAVKAEKSSIPSIELPLALYATKSHLVVVIILCCAYSFAGLFIAAGNIQAAYPISLVGLLMACMGVVFLIAAARLAAPNKPVIIIHKQGVEIFMNALFKRPTNKQILWSDIFDITLRQRSSFNGSNGRMTVDVLLILLQSKKPISKILHGYKDKNNQFYSAENIHQILEQQLQLYRANPSKSYH